MPNIPTLLKMDDSLVSRILARSSSFETRSALDILE